jgi:hypothetical protein
MADDRTNKNKAIEVALTQIEKQFGKGSCVSATALILRV